MIFQTIFSALKFFLQQLCANPCRVHRDFDCEQVVKGTAIKIIDGTAIADYRMVEYLKSVAENNEIQWQSEILPAGGTDTAAIQQYGRGGSIAGAISIPTRYLHQTIEMVSENDVLNSISLLTEAVKGLAQFDWGHR
ncbi:MAG: hypothetical protein EA362_02940 [Saprospirales bacterium]|nr:MAG: hypothetical protein EA362_02940 [Saprospirales bacterium]